jgi:fibronectin-binding autotransporter adhesin
VRKGEKLSRFFLRFSLTPKPPRLYCILYFSIHGWGFSGMKKALLALALLSLIGRIGLADLYWDSNADTPGAGTTPNGTWGTDTFWSADPAGAAATAGWTSGETAVFSAGTDATGAYTVTISGTQTAAGIRVEEGSVIIAGAGAAALGTGTVTLSSGTTFTIPSILRVTQTAGSGGVVLNGGTLRNNAVASAGASFWDPDGNISLGSGTGTISTDNLSGHLYSGRILGPGTLTKAGTGDFRTQNTTTFNTFTKLVVDGGMYRPGNALAVNFNENTLAAGSGGVFGTIPSSFLADAITLNNGGAIGNVNNVTLHNNRGITLGVTGGTISVDNGVMTIPGAISGPGNLTIGRVTTTSGNARVVLSGNNTYDGNTLVNNGILHVQSATALGSTVGNTQVATGAELRFDSAASSVTINEPITIAGIGAGGGGAITVQNSAVATLSGPITLSGDATVTVSGVSTVTYDNPASFTGVNRNLTVQGGAGVGGGGTVTGTINLGTGSLTKLQGGTWRLNSAAGNTYSGGTTISSGTLLVNNTTGSGTGTGAVAVNGGTLGGSGTIAGPVTVGAATVAPGESPGTLTINNTFVLNPASALAYELNGANQTVGGGVNDLITGITNLTLDGTLNITETVAGSFLAAMNGDTWRLLNYTGLLVDNGLTLGTVPSLAAGLEFTIDTSTFGQVDLRVVPEAGSIAALGLVGILSAAAVWFKKRRAQQAAV